VAKIRYGVPYWLDRVPSSRRPTYPRHRGRIDVDVAIAGGGMVGCVTAQVFAAAGLDVALFESSRIAQGGTMADDGLVLHEPGPDIQDLLARHGLRRAKQIAHESRRASLDFVAAIRRLRIACGLQVGDAISFVPAAQDEKRVRRECAARREAGLEASLLTRSRMLGEAALAGCGIRSRNHAAIDPYRACLGFARTAAGRGAHIFEQSPVLRVRPGRRHVEIRTESGTVTAATVIIATGHPTGEFKPLSRHVTLQHSYAAVTPPLSAGIRRAFGPPALMLRELARPGHRLRWLHDERVLFSGADQPLVPDRARAKTIVQRTGQLMYELSVLYPAISGIAPDYGWDVSCARTVDDVPYFGPHRNYPRHLFAFGSGQGSLGLSYLAARILLRHHLGAPDTSDELFSFTRTKG
jgi:glycine/D-amino acid oxidase-like deaminating enzyme